MEKQIFSIWVKNKLGVLSEVASVFGDAEINIQSLAVGVSEDEDISRITIVSDGDEESVAVLTAKINGMPNIVRMEKIINENSVLRELAMIRVNAPESKRQNIMAIAEIFRAQVVDVGLRSMTLELSGAKVKIQAMEDLLKPFGIQEVVRTGIIAIERGARG
ncbi:MAG: acetolactate synthase small subunit [Clostridiales bacterium]|nr:acetolactate synthase small subunit [Clostridiales bacterium]